MRERVAYETEWTICHWPWPQLLSDRGFAATPYDRSALERMAGTFYFDPSQSPYHPVGRLQRLAVDGCVDGFRHFLKTDRAAALP